MLRLDVHFLTGVCRAADATRERPEWPPHPDRIFSALVCAWAENGADSAGERGLRWLESLRPPAIEARPAAARNVPTVYVPPNDRSAGRRELGLPARLQARAFPAVVPEEPTVHYWWQAGEDEIARHLPALDRVARAVGYLGHSASLVAMRFVRERRRPEARFLPDPDGRVHLRLPYPGRFEELVRGYATATKQKNRKEAWRPEPAPAFAYRDREEEPDAVELPVGSYGRDWLVLAGAEARTPALEAFAPVAEAMRNAVLAHAEEPVPPLLSGHAGDAVLEAPHLAVLPMANVGFDRSDGRLFGLALVLPREHDGLGGPVRSALERAVRGFLRAGGRLTVGRFGGWTLVHEPTPEKASLRPGRYLRPARGFATVTPIVLPRHMKRKRGDTVEAQIALACRQQGLPEPATIEAGPHPFLRGSTFASKRHWRVTGRFTSRSLVHARLVFAEPVRGPLLLGAGRHFGLGLMLPFAEDG